MVDNFSLINIPTIVLQIFCTQEEELLDLEKVELKFNSFVCKYFEDIHDDKCDIKRTVPSVL